MTLQLVSVTYGLRSSRKSLLRADEQCYLGCPAQNLVNTYRAKAHLKNFLKPG